MKRSVHAVLSFVLLFFLVVSGGSLGVSALESVEDSTTDVVGGYFYDFQPFFASSSNFGFDISKIDWYSSAPEAVTQILSSSVVQNPSVDSMQPFAAIFVTSNNYASVFVGYNISPLFRVAKADTESDSSWIKLGYIQTSGNSAQFHCLYRAAFNGSGELVEAWKPLELVQSNQLTNSSGTISQYMFSYEGTSYQASYTNPKRDIYIYGASGGQLTTVDVNYKTYYMDSYKYTIYFNSFTGGYKTGLIPSAIGGNFPDVYQSVFTPPTFEQWKEGREEARHTSLLDKIKEIPNLILDGLKSLFIPADGYFSTYFDDLNNFFKDRFGFLYELPAFVVTLFQKLIDFSPDVEGYSMTFPELQAPEVVDGDVVWHDLSSEQTFDFSFLNDEPFRTFYSVYKSLIWLGYCVLLLNLVKRKFSSVFGGD